jgi:hypothetical protein
MSERKKRKITSASKGRSSPKRPTRATEESPPAPRGHDSPLSSFIDSISGLTTDLTSTALKIASRTAKLPRGRLPARPSNCA